MSKKGCRVSRIGHVGIHVSDIDSSIEFYRKVLGVKVSSKAGPPDFIRPVCFMDLMGGGVRAGADCSRRLPDQNGSIKISSKAASGLHGRAGECGAMARGP